MSSVTLDANVTIKKNKTLKKEIQVGDNLVYKDYIAPDGAGEVIIDGIRLDFTDGEIHCSHNNSRLWL